MSTGVKAEKKWIRLLERRHWRGKRYIVKKEKLKILVRRKAQQQGD